MSSIFDLLIAKVIATIVVVGGGAFTAVTVFCAPSISTKAAMVIMMFCIFASSMLTIGIWSKDKKKEKP